MAQIPTGPEFNAADKVSAPATALMIFAGIGGVLAVVLLLMNLLGIGAGVMGLEGVEVEGMEEGEQVAPAVLSGTVAVISNLIGVVMAIVIYVGAAKMKRLENYGFAMASSILAMVPCVSPCCILGLPFGIWSLVVLTKPDVKAAFLDTARPLP